MMLLLVRPGYGPATAEAFAETSEALRQDERRLAGVGKEGGRVKKN